MGLPEPTDLSSAQASPNWDVPNGYKEATETELARWKQMNVYKPVGNIPDRSLALNMRLLYNVKTDDKGNFKKAKMRLIVLGHRAIHGEHFLENCATTMKWPSFRTTMAVAQSLGAHM